MQAKKINEKIATITSDRSTVIASYHITDDSVQTEVRRFAAWSIRFPVDQIAYPKNLAREQNPLWDEMRDLGYKILAAAEVKSDGASVIIPINARRKNGDRLRAEARAAWEIETGRRFLADYRAATGKRNLAAIRVKIAGLQSQRKKLLSQLRAANSAYLAGKKVEREAQAIKNADAIKSGRFWEADKDTLKKYFHPPFDKNYLADVSGKWRAALFLDCESISYKYYGGWGHKLGGTGAGYLCGIDDNGDEWGHEIRNLPQSPDQYGNAALDSTVEEAMGELFGISPSALVDCVRQGDFLFCKTKIRTEDSQEYCRRCGQDRDGHYRSTDDETGQVYLACHYVGGLEQYEPTVDKAITLNPQSEPWDVRESHRIESPTLERNGRYFRSADPIKITHTSHAPVILPPGEYRLYAIRIEDAD